MRSRSRLLIALSALFGAIFGPPTSGDGQEATVRSMVFENATVIDMTQEKTPELASVWVRDGQIEAIGSLDGLRIPAETPRIDASGKYLMPGLSDSHVHLFDPNDLPIYLAHGITSVLNMSGAALQLDLRNQVETGELAGPTIYTTGPQLKIGAQPLVDFERLVDTPEAAERLVAFQAQAGYDFIKVWGAVSPEIYRAIMTAADRHDIRVTGHIPRDVGLEAVLESGQSSIAHVEEFFNKVFDRQTDETAIPAAAETTQRAGIPVITTLVTYEAIAGSIAEDPSPLLQREARQLLDPVRQLLWEPGYNRFRTEGRLGRDALYRQRLEFKQRIARGLHEAGVPLVAGSDAGELPGLVPGADLHRELALLEQAGLSRFEVLQTATTNAGRFLSMETSFGTIEVGGRADLLLLDANPLDDLDHLRRVAGVVASGRWHTMDDIELMLEAVREINLRTGRFADVLLEEGIDAAETYVDQFAGDGPPFGETPALFLAFMLAEQGDMEGALRVIQLVGRAAPESYLPPYMIGVALLGAGQIEAGRAALQQALRLEPSHDGAKALLEEIGGG